MFHLQNNSWILIRVDVRSADTWNYAFNRRLTDLLPRYRWRNQSLSCTWCISALRQNLRTWLSEICLLHIARITTIETPRNPFDLIIIGTSSFSTASQTQFNENHNEDDLGSHAFLTNECQQEHIHDHPESLRRPSPTKPDFKAEQPLPSDLQKNVQWMGASVESSSRTLLSHRPDHQRHYNDKTRLGSMKIALSASPNATKSPRIAVSSRLQYLWIVSDPRCDLSRPSTLPL